MAPTMTELEKFLHMYERLPIPERFPHYWNPHVKYINSRTEKRQYKLREKTEDDFRNEFPFLEDQRLVKLIFIQLIILSKI